MIDKYTMHPIRWKRRPVRGSLREAIFAAIDKGWIDVVFSSDGRVIDWRITEAGKARREEVALARQQQASA